MELFTQIRDIKAKAAESEAMVRDITRDIKQVCPLIAFCLTCPEILSTFKVKTNDSQRD